MGGRKCVVHVRKPCQFANQSNSFTMADAFSGGRAKRGWTLAKHKRPLQRREPQKPRTKLGSAPPAKLGGSKPTTARMLRLPPSTSAMVCIKRQLVGLRGAPARTRNALYDLWYDDLTLGTERIGCLSALWLKLRGRVEPEVEELGPAVDAEFSVDGDGVLVGGGRRDAHRCADLFLAQPIEQQVQCGLFSRRQ